MSDTVMMQAKQIYQRVLPELFRRRNVVACGLGYKVSHGQQTDQLSLIVSVVQKIPASALSSQDIIPQSLDGLVTDVVETGVFRALMPPNPTERQRPAWPGASIGHYQITAGTLGLLVQKEGRTYVLSNNHVLANSNDAEIGDPILQPGPLDGGLDGDRIAELAEFEPLDFGEQQAECDIARTIADLLNTLADVMGSSHQLHPVQKTPGRNLMDAALALVDAPNLVIPAISGLGIPAGTGEPGLGQAVQKMGRTTGLSEGVVQQIDVTVNVDYQGRQAVFTDQIITSPMSQPGDSGSAILDMDCNVVGLLFGGSNFATIFTPIQRVLDQFSVEVITNE